MRDGSHRTRSFGSRRRSSDAPLGTTCTRWRTTSIHGPCGPGVAAARSARRGRAARRGRRFHELDADVVALVDRVARRLRGARRVGRTVVLRLRFGDYSRATRSHPLPHSTASTAAILAAAWPEIERRGVTLVGVAVANLEDADTVQPPLPFDRRDDDALDAALDEVRDRFGSSAITRAVLVGREHGWTMPLLPD